MSENALTLDCREGGAGNGQGGISSSIWRQYLTLVNLSIRRYLFTRYMWVLLGLGLIPVFFTGLYCLTRLVGPLPYSAPYIQLNAILQGMFRFFYIHFIIFFVANIFGFSLLRKEIDDRTLHHLLLQPVNKSTVILSKYIGFLIVTWILLSVTFLISYVLLFAPYGIRSLMTDLFEHGRVVSLVKECMVMLLALAMYGAFSMVMGTIFKTAWFGLVFYLWETGLPYLPSTMKFFTFSHYFQALTPEKSAIPPKMFEMYGEFPSPLRCYITLGIILAFLTALTVFLIRRCECKYSES